jgi:hypothetical protein
MLRSALVRIIGLLLTGVALINHAVGQQQPTGSSDYLRQAQDSAIFIYGAFPLPSSLASVAGKLLLPQMKCCFKPVPFVPTPDPDHSRIPQPPTSCRTSRVAAGRLPRTRSSLTIINWISLVFLRNSLIDGSAG